MQNDVHIEMTLFTLEWNVPTHYHAVYSGMQWHKTQTQPSRWYDSYRPLYHLHPMLDHIVGEWMALHAFLRLVADCLDAGVNKLNIKPWHVYFCVNCGSRDVQAQDWSWTRRCTRSSRCIRRRYHFWWKWLPRRSTHYSVLWPFVMIVSH